jgi:hypothetical protein
MTVSIIATERIQYAPGKALNYDTLQITCDLCGEDVPRPVGFR